MKVFAIAINTYREAIRNRILYAVVAFGMVLVALSAFFGAVSIGNQADVIKDFGLFSLSFCGAVLTILSGVNLLHNEMAHKTVYNILSKPVSRWQFILGKQLGLALMVSVMVAFMGIGLVLFVALFEGAVDLTLFQAVLFIILEVYLLSAVTIFFSSLVVTTSLSGVFTFGTYLGGRSIAYLREYVSSHPEEAGQLRGVVSVFDSVLPDLSLFNLNDFIVYGGAVSWAYFLNALLYAFIYSALALLLASCIFANRELV
jgi:ABC-type transport system involved in multi-copper enzyme maturation permease subunit